MAGPWEKYTAAAQGPWSKYSAEPKTVGPETGAGEAALEHFGNTATMGYLPHIQAGVEQLTPDPGADTDAALKEQGFTINQPDQSYLSSRDANLKRLELEGTEHPVASGAGTVAGVAASALMPAKALAKGASLGAKAWQGLKMGGAYGALANPGDKEGEIDPTQLGGRLKGAAIGAGIGAAAPVVIAGASSAAQKVSDFLRKKAALKATRSLGRPTPTEAVKMSNSGQDVELGRELLDAEAIPVLGTPGRIKARVDELKEAAGERIGQLIDDAQAGGQAEKVEYTPIRITNPKKPIEVSPEVRATPIRFDENPARRMAPWLSERDAPPRLVRGEEQVVQKAAYEPGKPQVIAGKVREIKTPRNSIDAGKIGDSILNSSELELMRKTPGMEGAVAKIEQQVETLSKNGKMDLKQAHALRQEIDKSINWNKANPDVGAAEGLHMQRTKIRDAMNENINGLNPGAPKDQLLTANRKYGNMAKAQDILEKELGRNQANRSISVTDTIAGAAGMANGGPIGAAVLSGLNKAGRTFGNSAQARTYDAISKKLAGVPALAAKADANPAVAQMVAQRMARGKSEFERNDDIDAILKNPQLMDIYRKDPSRIDAIQDVQIRNLVKRAVGTGRKPADQGSRGGSP